MITKIDVSYNAIFGRLLCNELCAVISPKYLMMKFKTEKRIASIRSNQVEARKGCMLVAKVAVKHPKVMILETQEEWDR